MTSLGTLSSDNGTVTYLGTDQDIFGDTYNNLIIGGSTGTKMLGGNVFVNSDFTVNVGVTTAVGANTLTITDSTDINGTIIISTGTLDVDGAFDATNGFMTFTGDGNLTLASTVTSLGTLSSNNGTVTYDGTDQSVLGDWYYNLVIGGSSGTKTLDGNVNVYRGGRLTVNTGVTCAVGTSLLTVSGSIDISGNITRSTCTIDAVTYSSGNFDGTDGVIFFIGDGKLNLHPTFTSTGDASIT